MCRFILPFVFIYYKLVTIAFWHLNRISRSSVKHLIHLVDSLAYEYGTSFHNLFILISQQTNGPQDRKQA